MVRIMLGHGLPDDQKAFVIRADWRAVQIDDIGE